MFQRALWEGHRQPAGEPGGKVQPGRVEGQSLRNAESHLPEQRVNEPGVGAAQLSLQLFTFVPQQLEQPCRGGSGARLQRIGTAEFELRGGRHRRTQ